MRALLRSLCDGFNKTPTTFIGWLAVGLVSLSHWGFGFGGLQPLLIMTALWMADMVAQAGERIGDDLRLIAIALKKSDTLPPRRETINLRIAFFLLILGVALLSYFRKQSATTNDLIGVLSVWLIFAGGATVEYVGHQLKNVRSGVENRVGL